MNEKTIKILKKYARRTGQGEEQVKQWWNSLDWRERTSERRRILAELARPDTAPAT